MRAALHPTSGFIMQLFVDKLTNVDFSYLHPQRGLVGETWLASALLDGGLDETSMIWDFGVVKKVLRNWLDDELDHRLLIPTQSKDLSYLIEAGRISLQWQFAGDQLTMEAPLEAVALVDCTEITDTSVAQWAISRLADFFPQNLEQLQLTFEAEEIKDAFYHYSHGLKKHDGNCQRIAHGHRSRIEIRKDGERDQWLESNWAERWADIYLGSTEDLVGESDGDQPAFHFAYDAPQGHFKLSIPQRVSYLMESDTTVECIAQHIAETLKKDFADHQIQVKAFEGLHKGAIFSA